MKRILLIATVALLAIAIGVAPVLAKGPSGPSGKSTTGHLYLLEKDPTTWEVIESETWGKLNYRCKDGFSYVFNGHGLEPGARYELVNYVDPWPGAGSQSLGTAVADEEGDVHIMGWVECLEVGTPVGGTEPLPGAKIWLVLDDDFDKDASTMVGWNPTGYLFEEALTACCLCE